MAGSDITKLALADSIKQLMAEKPFEKISVGEICDRCGMNRKSFYYHFRDKYDLVNWIFDVEFLSCIQLVDYTTGWALMSDVCRYFYSQRAFYKNALSVSGQNSFRDYLRESLDPFISSLSEDVLTGVSNSDFYVTFFADAFNAAMLRWLCEGNCPADEFLQNLKRLILNFSKAVIERLDD